MKIRAATLRIYQQVHTWTGLLAGFALFIAFYAGALSVFRSDIDLWQSPPWQLQGPPPLSSQALVERLIREVPEAGEDFGLVLPEAGRSPYLFWFSRGQTHYLSAAPSASATDQPPDGRLADFIYALHYSLGLSTPGLYLMGVVSLLYGLALVSGVIIHLPGLVRQLFALHPGPNIKRLWNDAHNAVGVLSLPFHIVFALTGALFCLSAVLLLALGKTTMEPQLAGRYAQALAATAIAPAASGTQPRPMLAVPALLQQARAQADRIGSPGFQPSYMHFMHYGRADGHVEISGLRRHSLATYGSLDLAATDARLLGATVGRYASLNHNLSSSMYGLHFGNFGGRTVQWLYFVLGLAGAFLFYSGNLLWLESRRRRRHLDQPARVRWMARATLGLCLGTCLGISSDFALTGLAGFAGHQPSGLLISGGFLLVLLGACLLAALRPVPAAARELCLLTGGVSLLTAGLHLLTCLPVLGSHAGPAADVVLAVDLVGLVLGLGFLGLARAVRRRALGGDPHSIWAAREAGRSGRGAA